MTDLSHRLVISRLGQRLRIAGYAEIGVAHGINLHRIKSIAARMQTLFPDVAQFAQGSAWSGLRPMTPDGAPIIDCAPDDENLWLTTGHGSLGWTFSHGSARLLADKLAQKQPRLIQLYWVLTGSSGAKEWHFVYQRQVDRRLTVQP